jgi:hypothetical protein
MKTRKLLLLGCLVALGVQAQEVRRELWKWTDANGVVHFSDTPGPGATRLKLDYSAAPSSASQAVAQPGPSEEAQPNPSAPTTYRSVTITQPESGASFFGADAVVNVAIETDPQLSPQDRLVLLVDGNQVAGGSQGSRFALSNLERGAHTVTAVVQDENGRERIRSSGVEFFIKQPTIIPPAAVGPGVRPVPRPTPRGG